MLNLDPRLEHLEALHDSHHPLAENLRRIAESDELLVPFSMRVTPQLRQRIEALVGGLPKRQRARVLRELLEHAVATAEAGGFGARRYRPLTLPPRR